MPDRRKPINKGYLKRFQVAFILCAKLKASAYRR